MGTQMLRLRPRSLRMSASSSHRRSDEFHSMPRMKHMFKCCRATVLQICQKRRCEGYHSAQPQRDGSCNDQIRFRGGSFVQHCHNLEHEDDGMMRNFMVQGPPRLNIAASAPGIRLSRSTNIIGYSLQTSATLDAWSASVVVPTVQSSNYFLLLARANFWSSFRLVKQ